MDYNKEYLRNVCFINVLDAYLALTLLKMIKVYELINYSSHMLLVITFQFKFKYRSIANFKSTKS